MNTAIDRQWYGAKRQKWGESMGRPELRNPDRVGWQANAEQMGSHSLSPSRYRVHAK